jgi:hypothetical protein
VLPLLAAGVVAASYAEVGGALQPVDKSGRCRLPLPSMLMQSIHPPLRLWQQRPSPPHRSNKLVR